MKLIYVLVFCFLFGISFSQEKQHTSSFDVNYFKGNIALHNNDILHLITGHPEGVILSWNKKTYGFNEWEQRFNYPDYGVSFAYQNLKNDVLGNITDPYGKFNYFVKAKHSGFIINVNESPIVTISIPVITCWVRVAPLCPHRIAGSTFTFLFLLLILHF